MERKQGNVERSSDSSDWVNFTVPTFWGKVFQTEKGNFVSLSVPVDGSYYSFIIPQERFNKSMKEDGMSYFSFPRTKKDDPDKEYEVRLRGSKRQADGSYKNTEITMTSEVLKKHVDAAKDICIGVDISEKLIRSFEGRDGKKFAEVSVPVYEEGTTIFYKIVLPEKRVIDSTKEGQKHLSLFKDGPDGEEYKFNAKRGVQDEDGNWTVVEKLLTSREVVVAFKDSAKRYREQCVAGDLNPGETAGQQADPHRRAGRR